MLLNDLLPQTIWQVAFVFARTGGLVMGMVGIGESYVPVRVRLGVGLLLAVLMAPTVTLLIPPLPDNPIEIFIWTAGELVIGLFMGSLSQLIMASLQVAGTIIAFQIGLANAFIFNPATAQQSSVYGAFLGVLGMLLLLTSGLHHMLFIAIRDSYKLFPPGEWALPGDLASYYAQTLSDTFTIGLQISMPFIVVGMMFYLMLGVLARLMPQLQIFFLALPMQLLLGTLIFLPTLFVIGEWFMEFFEVTIARFITS